VKLSIEKNGAVLQSGSLYGAILHQHLQPLCFKLIKYFTCFTADNSPAGLKHENGTNNAAVYAVFMPLNPGPAGGQNRVHTSCDSETDMMIMGFRPEMYP